MEVSKELLLSKLRNDPDFLEIKKSFESWENETKRNAIEDAKCYFDKKMASINHTLKKQRYKNTREFQIDEEAKLFGISFKTFCVFYYTLLDMLYECEAGGEYTIADIIDFMEQAVELVNTKRGYILSTEEQILFKQMQEYAKLHS